MIDTAVATVVRKQIVSIGFMRLDHAMTEHGR